MSPTPFALLTPDLVFLPSPAAVDVESYRTLFRRLNADPVFCNTAYGDAYAPLVWTDEEVRTFLLERDVAKRWNVRGMGDFALGLLPVDGDGKTAFHSLSGELVKSPQEQVHIIAGDAYRELQQLLPQVQWVGYTCVRDATTCGGEVTELYAKTDHKSLPPWQEMIEMRYGMDPGFTGRGVATRAAHVAIQWAIQEHGAWRFIGATIPSNVRSQALLARLGFEKIGTKYFGYDEDKVIEWANWADQDHGTKN
jgi:hypothetical protein